MVLTTTHTAGDIDKLCRRWGWTFVEQGRDHRRLKHPSGKTIDLKRKNSSFVNQYVLNEIFKITGVSELEFFEGPKVEPEPETVVAKLPTVSVPADSNGAATNEVVLPPLQNRKLNTQPRRKVIEFLHANGGKVEDASGYVMGWMAEKIGTKGNALSMLILSMQADGQVKKSNTAPNGKVNPKKTFKIELCYDGPLVRQITNAMPVPETTPQDSVPVKTAGEEEVKAPQSQAPELDTPASPVPQEVTFELDYRKIAEEVVKNFVHRLTVLEREHALREENELLKERIAKLNTYARRLKREKEELERKVASRPIVRTR